VGKTEANTPKLSSTPARAPGLERDKVVQAALDLLDEAGFEKLTLRRVADRLGVKAAALYWHFQNKQDLIDAMAMQVLCGQPRYFGTHVQHMPWQDLLRKIGRRQRQALLSRRDGARLIASADMARMPLLEGMERILTVLRAQGFPADLALLSLIAISRYTLGCVFEEQADPRPKEDALKVRHQMLQESADRFRVAAQTFAELAARQALTPTRQYEQGLELLISGIGCQLQEPKA